MQRLQVGFDISQAESDVLPHLQVRHSVETSPPGSLVNPRRRYRYNEQRILLGCSRVTDPTLSTLRLVQKVANDGETWSPQPAFIIRIKPSRLLLFFVAVLFGMGLILLNLGPADLQVVGLRHADLIYKICKVIGLLLIIIASYRYLRKFPLK